MPQKLNTLAGRVAQRHLTSAFIPDKIWKEGLSDLKRVFDLPVDEPLDVVLFINDRVRPFFGLFITRLKNMGLNQYAEGMLDDRMSFLSREFQIISDRAEAFNRETQTSNYPRATALDEIHLSIESHLKTVYRETLPTMGKALKKTLTLKPGSTKELAKRLTKKATPEELEAIFAVSQGNYNHGPLNRAHAFYKRVNLEGLAEKLIVKEKIEREYTKWFAYLKDSLDANYSEKALDRDSLFREFNIGNLKAVVLAPEASAFSMPTYGKLLGKARALLERKGFGKVWRGALLINSNQYKQLSEAEKGAYEKLGYLGLDNQAGTYHSGDDIVRITAPANEDLVRIVVHEMGHRYWFKVMKPEQRARFNGLVKTNASPKTRDFPSGPTEDGVEKPVVPVSDYGASSIEEAFAEVFTHYVLGYDITRDQLESFRTVLAYSPPYDYRRSVLALATVTPDQLDKWRKDLRVLTKIYRDIPADSSEKAVEQMNEARQIFQAFRKNFEAWVYKFLLPAIDKEKQGFLYRDVQKEAWSALLAIGDLFPASYDYHVKQHTPAPWELKNVREKNIARYNKAFNAAFKTIDDFLEHSPQSKADRYEDERHNIAGMNVRVVGHGRGESEDNLDGFLKSLHSFAGPIQRAGFASALKGLNVVVDYDPDRREFLVNGLYQPQGDKMTFLPLGLAGSRDQVQGTFTHEVGHRFWFKELPAQARAHWNEVMSEGGELVKITAQDVDSFAKFVASMVRDSFVPETYEILSAIKRLPVDDATKAKYREMSHVTPYSFSSLGFDFADYKGRLMDREGETILIEEVSDYANSGGPIESFAEVFRLYVTKGPGAIGPGTRHLFEQVTRAGGAKTAARVAQRYTTRSK